LSKKMYLAKVSNGDNTNLVEQPLEIIIGSFFAEQKAAPEGPLAT
jgi:hypothetical protein